MRPNPTESRWPAALVAVLVIPAALATAQTASHGALVELYRDDPDGAVAELGRWDLRAVERQIARIDSRPRSRRAAIMLHTERALADLAQRRQEFGELHLAAAAAHLDLLLDGGDDFRRRWHVGVAAYLLLGLDPLSAEGFVRRAVASWPEDPDVLVVRGAIHEFVASIPLPAVPDAFLAQNSRAWRDLQRERADRRRRRERAAQAYRSALASDEQHAEARLRLGRVLQIEGKIREARRELSWVIDHDRSPDLSYLAALFLGRMEEEMGDLRAAEANYRLATRALPGAQAAGVALSHLLGRRGDARSARSVAHAGLVAQRGLPIDFDPWSFYPQGSPVSVEALMAALRHEARTGP